MPGSEGKQNNEMSATDIEEEEMAQELMSMEMYEVGMGFQQMKEILQFINESRNMAGIEPENRVSQEVNKYSQEITAQEAVGKNNSTRNLILEENSLPKPSYSYRTQSGKVSPTTSGLKSALEILPVEEMSVTSPDIFVTEEPQRSGAEGESIFDKLVKANDVVDKNETTESRSQTPSKNAWHIMSDSTSNSPDPQNSQNVETNVEIVKSRRNQRIERWRMDPTNAVIAENDVPLEQKTRPVLMEKVPYSFCHYKRVLDASTREKVLAVLTSTMEEVADIWRRKHRPDVTEFQWGSPIKVGTNNHSLDKKPIKEEADSPQRSQMINRNSDSVQRRGIDRNCKRKATEYIQDLVQNEINSNEDSDDNIFESVKKPKTTNKLLAPLAKTYAISSEKNLTRQEKIFNNLKSNKVEPLSVIGEYDSDDFDNDDLSSLCRKNKNKDEHTGQTLSPEEFPRRIVPPNPSKPKAVRGPRKNGEGRGKRKSPVRKNAQAVLEADKNIRQSIGRGRSRISIVKSTNSQTATLNDDDIVNELKKNDSEENEDDIVIRPMPVKGLTSKLQQGASLLLETKKAEERMKEEKIQEQLKAQMKEKLAREELQNQRYVREKKAQEDKKAKEMELKAKEETWKKNEAIRDRDRRRRLAQAAKRFAESGKELLLMEDDEEAVIHNINVEQRSMEERVECPICLLEFSKGEIQNHAADCNQFNNLVEPGTSRSPASNDELTITNEHAILDCNICSRFSTTNGITYNEHVRSYSPEIDLVTVPTSPIRCFVPISKQTESAINYAEQFPDRKGKQSITRSKRRR